MSSILSPIRFLSSRFYLVIILITIVHLQVIEAQIIVEGKVMDASLNPLIGVHISQMSTGFTDFTDLEGSFTIEADSTDLNFVFSYTGFESKRVELNPNKLNEITLDEGIMLDELVFTALGVERIKDQDLSSATLIKPELLWRSGEIGVIQSLAAKASGLMITNNSGDPGAGAYLQIRAQNTVLGNGSPLIILDGMPISNSSKIQGFNAVSEAATNTLGGLTEQSRLNDISASDISSVTVLKGASAASLYGSGAANGVIVIKTKMADLPNNKKIAVEAGFSLGAELVNKEFETQTIFGQGVPSQWLTNDPNQINWSGFGIWSNSSFGSWGDRISERSGEADVVDKTGSYFESKNGNLYYPVINKNSTELYHKSNRNQIFKTGLNRQYNIGVQFSDTHTKAYLGFARTDQEGMYRSGANYHKNSLKLNYKLQLHPKLQLSLYNSFIHSKADRIQKGASVNSLYITYLRTPADFDNTDYEGTYVNEVGELKSAHRGYRSHLGSNIPVYNNPRWTLNNQLNPSTLNRFIFMPELQYQFTEQINVTARYGTDYFIDNRRTYYPVNSAGDFGAGAYFKDLITERMSHFNIYAQGDHANGLTDINWILGYSLDEQKYERNGLSVQGFINDNVDIQVFDNAFSSNQDAYDYKTLYRKNGAFANFSAGFLGGKYLLETSGRIERSASLPDKAFFYPSISAGWVFSKHQIINEIIDFGKLRVSYGEIGIEPPLYSNADIFTFSTAGSEELGDQLDGANYEGTFKRGFVKGNPDLEVERVKEWEAGIDLRFLDHRFGLSMDLFHRNNTNVILPSELPPSSGYGSIFRNAAQIKNKGVELELNYKIIAQKNLDWDVFLNASTYKSEVTSLPGVSRYVLDGFFVNSVVTEGSSFGALWGGKWLRGENDEILLNENGFPKVDPVQGVIGDPNPNWMASLSSGIRYKNLSLTFLIESVQGQEMWAGTSSVLQFFGLHTETANISISDQDLTTVTGAVIPANTEFRGNIHDFGGGPVALDANWYTDLGGGYSPVTEQFIQDASWIRLRDVGLNYTLKAPVLSEGIETIDIGFKARNLWLYTEMEGIDPDSNLTGASKARGLEYFSNPGSKSFIFSINATF